MPPCGACLSAPTERERGALEVMTEAYLGMQVHHHPGNWSDPDTFDPVSAWGERPGPQIIFTASHACLAPCWMSIGSTLRFRSMS